MHMDTYMYVCASYISKLYFLLRSIHHKVFYDNLHEFHIFCNEFLVIVILIGKIYKYLDYYKEECQYQQKYKEKSKFKRVKEVEIRNIKGKNKGNIIRTDISIQIL